MPANNSKTNVNIRRIAALNRFSLDPKRMDDKEYQERKEAEKTALQKQRF
jgi:hypothetical protein